MSEKKVAFDPTPAQENAINANGGGIIVSAAAGSGKTRVLVQRVIRMLTGENAVPADRLLILTFTNTAAAEMKTRISQAIDELIAENPDNDFYRRQQLLLSSADICTIDSFCSKVVRENFFRLGVSRDFRIGSAAELYELKRRIMSDIIEQYYLPPEEGSEDYESKRKTYESFNILSMLMSSAKLDNDLEEGLLDAYTKYTAHAFPDLWIDKCVEQYDPGKSISESGASVYLIDKIKPLVSKLHKFFDRAMEHYEGVKEELEEKLAAKKGTKSYENAMEAYKKYRDFLDRIEELYCGGEKNISAIAEMFIGFSKVRVANNANVGDSFKAASKELNGFASTVIDEISPYICYTGEIFRQNNEQLYPVMQCLRELLQKFDREYFNAKREKGILEFSDLESLVLKLLYEYDENTGEYVRTEFAKETAEKYYEIMIDEYQDTNDVQESIFKAISKNEENLFVVGDVKQSIYRFREANPTLFKRRCAAAELYDKDHQLFPALIVLDKNFRSRSGIINSVNYVFGLIMSEKSGEIEYDETHKLTTGAFYPEKEDPQTELHIIEYKKDDNSSESEDEDKSDEEDADKDKTEAIYCARLIKDIVDRGDTVYDAREKRMRKVVYSDFCILMRAVKNIAHIYSSELEKCGIPAYTDTDFDLLERYEVKAALAYLKVLNNPISDIDMTAALMCPVFGFTPDELAVIKKVEEKRYYKKLLYLCSEEGREEQPVLSEKCRGFIDEMKKLRELAVTLPTDKLLQEFFERTAFLSVMNAMPNGEFRVQNLRRLMNFISEYEAGTAGGLTGFVRHIRYLEETGSGIRVSDNAPVNAVKIMTIHHSKGLEFPICIMAGTNREGAKDKDKVKYHSDLGIGLHTIDMEKLLQFNTLQFSAIKKAAELEQKSELLRLLYVAMTRAKERLIILSTVTTEKTNAEENNSDDKKKKKKPSLTKYRKYLNDLANKISYDADTGHISAEAVVSCKTFSDWLVMCALLNGDMHELREDACIVGEAICDQPEFEVELPALKCASEWKFVHVEDVEESFVKKTAAVESVTDDRLENFLHKHFSENKNDISTRIPSKVSASMLAHRELSMQYVAYSKPAFAQSGGSSPTEKGTATHAFLQYADIKSLGEEIAQSGTFEKEKESVVVKKLMTKEQAALIIDKHISAFAESDIFRRMQNAEKLYREYRFTVNIPAEMAVSGGISGENIPDGCETILQGAIDCIIEEEDGIVIVDYKTDRVKDPQELADVYGLQLRLYREAANRIFDKPVKECYIYSLHCGCEIPV